MNEFLRTGGERWRASHESLLAAEKSGDAYRVTLDAHVAHRVAEAEDAIREFLRLMAAHGNPGLVRWRLTRKGGHSHATKWQQRVWLFGWRAWKEAQNLNTRGQFRQIHTNRWVDARSKLRGDFASQVSGYNVDRRPPTFQEVDQRFKSFCEQLGAALASNGVRV